MLRILIVAEDPSPVRELASGLAARGFACSILEARGVEDTLRQVVEAAPKVLLVQTDWCALDRRAFDLARRLKERRAVPIIALLPREELRAVEAALPVDDFVVSPWDEYEVSYRIVRAVKDADDTGGEELIRCGDLLIDPVKCEVAVGGRPVTLTFKEYELLKFLATNKGRVFTREALLDEVWGDDYYGGDRTVDVHIRRLRSKIEDPAHTFIDTVRSIGYRFREGRSASKPSPSAAAPAHPRRRASARWRVDRPFHPAPEIPRMPPKHSRNSPVMCL